MEGQKKRLRRECWNPAPTDFPTIISIEIARPLLNLNSFPQFTMVKLSDFGNKLGVLNTHLMLGIFHMLC